MTETARTAGALLLGAALLLVGSCCDSGPPDLGPATLVVTEAPDDETAFLLGATATTSRRTVTLTYVDADGRAAAVTFAALQ